MTDKDKLAGIYKEMLEEDIIAELARVKDISLRNAMDIYYNSRLSAQISDGSYGIDNMDYRYLVQDLIDNEPELLNAGGQSK